MTTDCIFDIASLSKPVSTAACINILIDRGRLKLDTKVSDIIPEFAAKEKQDITIAQLLTHTSGLPAYTNADSLAKKYGNPCRKHVIEQICSLDLQSKPGGTFRYSCLGYITLGRIVEIVSHKGLDEFARQNVFAPVGMKETGYSQDIALAQKIAPTELRNGQCLIGRVHDPLAELMEGVSGNAGVFSTAEDLARFCTMLLNNGKVRGRKVLSPSAVKMLTEPQALGRAYGFDVSSPYAWIKGDGFSPSAFCHSGYTGTSIVCDPVNNIYLIILTNRVHPADKGSLKNMRVRLADITSHTFIPHKDM
jgi:CubicO group peptidase (beta-lactamase class C family)